jgi:hypothetical protein
MNIWEIRYTGCNNWHKISFGKLEEFLLKNKEKLGQVQEIKLVVVE